MDLFRATGARVYRKGVSCKAMLEEDEQVKERVKLIDQYWKPTEIGAIAGRFEKDFQSIFGEGACT